MGVSSDLFGYQESNGINLIASFFLFFFCSDKEDLDDDKAAEKIVKLTAELGVEDDQDQEKSFDPVVERIKNGFNHFKTQHFE